MTDYKLRDLRASHTLGLVLLFIIRVKRELKRVQGGVGTGDAL
jgi:hypothetical protein